MIMERAFMRAYERTQHINPETINAALETFKNEDFGGLVPAITYTKKDHSASFTARMVKVKEDGSFIPLTNFTFPARIKSNYSKNRLRK